MLWLPLSYTANKNVLDTTALCCHQKCSGYHCPTLPPRMLWLPLSYAKNDLPTTALHCQECSVYHCPTLPRMLRLPLPYTATKMAMATTALHCHQDDYGYYCPTLSLRWLWISMPYTAPRMLWLYCPTLPPLNPYQVQLYTRVERNQGVATHRGEIY